jgi:hypothetical protein
VASHSPPHVAVQDALQLALHSAWFAALAQLPVHFVSHEPLQVPLQFAEQSKLALALHCPSQVPLHETSHDGGTKLHCPAHFA